MEEAKVTSKGQITIPKKQLIERLKGMLHRPGQKTLTVKEMNEGITEYLKEKYSK